MPNIDSFDDSIALDSRAAARDHEFSGLTEIISDPAEARRIFFNLLSSAKSEILVALPTTKAFHREEDSGLLHKIAQAAATGISVRILTPADLEIADVVLHQSDWDNIDHEEILRRIEYREIHASSTKTNITVVICDRKTSLAIELKDDPQVKFTDSIGKATLSKSEPTVLSYIAFFDALWNESEIRRRLELKTSELQRSISKEEKSKNQAELLQDVLTHDIRNHIQIALLSVEVLEAELPDEKDAPIFENLHSALNGTMALVERVKKLGKILSSNIEPVLYPVDLSRSIERAVDLVTKGNIGRVAQISISYDDEGLKGARVLADDFLDDAFVNLISNSVKFTRPAITPEIEVVVAETNSNLVENLGNFLKISISDNARGIVENSRKDIFTRYLKSASGSGLGMSIVHALIVDRYGGRITLGSKVEGDYARGTTFDLILPRA
ncbi:MAG: ATP-binding protein [Nitrososphaerales archaeon]